MPGRKSVLRGEANLGPGAEASRAMPKVDFGTKPASPGAERDGASPVSTRTGCYWSGVRARQESWSAMAAPVGS